MCLNVRYFFFFFSSRRRHTRYWRDWSSDVCSSDLACEFTLHCKVPLRRLRVAIVRQSILVEIARTCNEQWIIGSAHRRELVSRRTRFGIRIEGRAHNRHANVRRIEGQLAKIGHREDSKSSAQHCLVIPKRTVSKPEARLKIPLVELAEAGTETEGVGVFDGRTRQRGDYRSTALRGVRGRVDGCEETRTRNIPLRNDDSTIAHIKGREIRKVADERRQRLPAHPKRKRQPIVQPEFVLSIQTRLDRMRVHVWSGLRYKRLCRQPQQPICECIPREDALVKRKRAEIDRKSTRLNSSH